MTYKLDKTYEEKVYAGVLGKIIGVFLGRPFENWSYERIMKELGPINYYVNDKLDFPLPVSDDDITGTFTFLRAFKDFNYKKDLTQAQIRIAYTLLHHTRLRLNEIRLLTQMDIENAIKVSQFNIVH